MKAERKGSTGENNAKIAPHITQLERAEEALRESEERFQTIFEMAGAGIALATPAFARKAVKKAKRKRILRRGGTSVYISHGRVTRR